MKIVLITFGTAGDIYPYLELGSSLIKRGHEVTAISSDFFKGHFIKAGINFIPCGTSEEHLAVINNPEMAQSYKGIILIARYVMLNPMRQLYKLVSHFNPAETIIVASVFAVGARLACEKLNFPLVSICLQPAALWSLERAPIIPFFPFFYRLPPLLQKFILKQADSWLIDALFSSEVNQFRLELDLPPVKNIYSQWLYSPLKVIGLFPPWFAEPAIDWPKQVELTSFVQYKEKNTEALPIEVMDFINAGEEPLVFTYGTSMVHGHHFFKTSLEAVRLLGRRAIFVTPYTEQLPAKLPDYVLHVSYVSFNSLFPYIASLVHHGGIGTLAQALAAKVPQLIVPVVNDQFDNAFWLERLGAGLSLAPKNYSCQQVVVKLRELLDSASIRQACERYAEKVDFFEAQSKTCELIENIKA